MSSAANAEIAIQSDTDVAGTWRLVRSATSAEGQAEVSRRETWVIGNGQLERKGIQLARTGTYDIPPAAYHLKGGNLLMEVLGRSGKYRTFKLIDKSDDSMLLHEFSEGYLWFKRQ